MKRPEEVKIEFTHAWIRKAEGDFRTGQHLLDEGKKEYVYGVVFHAQQAAEKYLKAFLVWHQIEFPKTHDIEVLLKLAAAADAEIPEAMCEAADLTPYGVEYRYPGEYPDVTICDARKAIDLAVLVRAEILRRLPAGMLPSC